MARCVAVIRGAPEAEAQITGVLRLEQVSQEGGEGMRGGGDMMIIHDDGMHAGMHLFDDEGWTATLTFPFNMTKHFTQNRRHQRHHPPSLMGSSQVSHR